MVVGKSECGAEEGGSGERFGQLLGRIWGVEGGRVEVLSWGLFTVVAYYMGPITSAWFLLWI